MSASAIPLALCFPDPIPGELEHLKVTKASQATQLGSQSDARVPGPHAKWPLLESLSQLYPPSTCHLFITLLQGGLRIEPKPQKSPLDHTFKIS